MNKHMRPIGLEQLSTFVTADALLAAVLLVWAQLWIQPSVRLFAREYPCEAKIPLWDSFNLSAGLGLLWTYLAVLLALLALAWAGWCSLAKPSNKTPTLSLGLFAASIAMAVINVFQSLVTISLKVLKGDTIWKTLMPLEVQPWSWYSFSLLLAFSIITLSIWGIFTFNKNKRRYLPWKIELIVCLVFAGIGALLMREILGNLLFWISVAVLAVLVLGLSIYWFLAKRALDE